MRPLCGASAHLFRNVLKVGKRFAGPVGGDGRKPLIISLHQPIRAKGKRIAAAELLIGSHGTFGQEGVVGLDRSAVVAEFGVEAAACEESALFTELMAYR